jgi:hypothetical protein
MIKKSIILGALVAISSPAQADIGAMVGIGYTFGDAGPALTLKALSSDKKDEAVGALGFSYYPLSQNKFGVDVGIGYQFDKSAVILSWDLLQKAPQISAGWANTNVMSSMLKTSNTCSAKMITLGSVIWFDSVA